MPMLIFIIAELDFSWPSFNSGLYWVALGLKLKVLTVAGTVNEFHIVPHHINIINLLIKIKKFVKL
jgi:hypothetical protein